MVLTNGLDPNGGPNSSSEGASQQSLLNNMGKEGAYLSLLSEGLQCPTVPILTSGCPVTHPLRTLRSKGLLTPQ